MQRRTKLLLGAGITIITVVLLIRFYPNGDILGGKPLSQVILDRNGKVLRVFLAEDDTYRIWQDIGDFPPQFIEAVLLKEDRFFYSHPGFNPAALVKAGWQSYIIREKRVGASTITMQLVRLRSGLYTKSVPGKLKQIFEAVRLELKYSKTEILEAYLNLAPCGGNVEGFPAAAYLYFHKDLGELTLSEILFLVVLPQNPSVRSPGKGIIPGETITARRQLFQEWLEKHPEEADYVAQMEMPVSTFDSYPFRAPHFAEYVKNSFGEPGEPARTSLDLSYQKVLTHHLSSYVRDNRNMGVRNAVALLLDYTSMEILGAIGSADYFNEEISGQVNGFASKRSPGSTLKPFIFAMAIEQGLIHPETMMKDTPASFGSYTPDNFQSEFKGPVKAWEALVHSRNIPAITLEDRISEPDLHGFLKKAGISGLQDAGHYGLSIVLGSAGVTMLELVELYAALANGGEQYEVEFTPRQDTRNPSKRRLLTQESSYLTRKMLERNPPPIEHRPREVRDIPIAYKTGTSIGFKDCWSVAIFDRFILGVWIGNFDGEGNPSFLGRTMAAPLLFSITDALLMDMPEDERLSREPPPRGIAQVEVCSVSGGIPNEYCPNLITTDFLPGISPIHSCSIHREVFVDTRTGYRTSLREGEFIQRSVREFWPSDILELFESAGLPRFVAPPLDPSLGTSSLRQQGSPPEIISPLRKTEYIIRRNSERYKTITLVAAIDADVSEVFWFANNAFIGRSKSHERLEWQPDAGTYTLAVIDNIGRTSSIEVTVEIVD
jgi:penicillin-binding protein 1C